MIATAIKAQGGVVVVTNGCFDLIHTGHADFLTKAKRLGDCLIVLVNSDESITRLKGEDRPVIPLDQRMKMLDMLKPVDFVTHFSADTPRDLICSIDPDVLAKGNDYLSAEIAGSECVMNRGGKVEIVESDRSTSTTMIINKLFNRRDL